MPVAGGGLSYVDPDRPTSGYLALAGTEVQVEVYTPDAARTKELLAGGAVAAVR
jgi:hypothetical protein